MQAVAVKVFVGSTSSFDRVEGGMLIKSLHPSIAKKDGYKLTVEKEILMRLGKHPRIVEYVHSLLTVHSLQDSDPRCF